MSGHNMYTPVSTRAAGAYQRIQVETSAAQMDQHQIVSLLFEGLMQSIAAARGAMARGDIPGKCQAISKAIRILEEGLSTGLDRQSGGELAANLSDVYDFCTVQLVAANAHNDDAVLRKVAEIIEPIARGWNEISAEAHRAPQATGG